jgi:hypothetical protein
MYKKGILFSILFGSMILVQIACRKDNTNNNNITLISLIGSWELKREQSGMLPIINYTSGNGNILKFTDSDFQIFANGQLIKSGQYSIIGDNSVTAEVCLVIATDQYRNRIIYNDNPSGNKVFVQVFENKLTFLSGCFALDAGNYKEYVRN